MLQFFASLFVHPYSLSLPVSQPITLNKSKKVHTFLIEVNRDSWNFFYDYIVDYRFNFFLSFLFMVMIIFLILFSF